MVAETFRRWSCEDVNHPRFTRRAEAGGNLAGPRNAELLHSRLQGRTLHPQQSSGPFRPAENPPGLVERPQDVIFFRFRQSDQTRRVAVGVRLQFREWNMQYG